MTTNLTWLYGQNQDFADAVDEAAAKAIGSTNKSFAHTWLAMPCENAHESGGEPSSATEGTETDVRTESQEDEPQETLESLKEEISTSLYAADISGIPVDEETAFSWLERMAAITTRKCNEAGLLNCEACRSARKSKLAELEAERDYCRKRYKERMDYDARQLKRVLDERDELEEERDRWKANYEQRNEEANGYAARLEELESRKCPGYDADKHYCNYHAQNFELNDATVSRLKRENAKLSSDELHWRTEAETLSGKLESMTKSKEHFQRIAGKHSTTIQKLKRKLKECEGIDKHWPCYTDGVHVAIGDYIYYADEGYKRVQGIRFYSSGYVLEFPGVDHCEESYGFTYGNNGHIRMPLKAKDGQPIEEGEMLYGADGRAWVVESIDYSEKYPVEGSCDGEYKQLKPEWLTHEKPDSWERIAYDLRKVSSNLQAHVYRRDECERIDGIAERVDKLSKEGA